MVMILQKLRQPQFLVPAIVIFALIVSGVSFALYRAAISSTEVPNPSNSSTPPSSSDAATQDGDGTKTVSPDKKKSATGSKSSGTGSQSATGGSAQGTTSQSGTSSSGSTPPAPAGKVFALMDPGESSSSMQSYSALASVDGLAFRALWKTMEPSAGSYNWAAIDDALSAASGSGKKLTIHVGASGGGWPSWLTGLGTQTYTYSTPAGSRTDPIPWDSVYIQRYNQFVAALGAHVSASGKASTVYAASVGAPVAEMTIVGCVNGQLTGGTAYSRTSYLNAWKSTIGASASAYAGKKIFVSLPLSFICLNDGNDGKTFATELMNSMKASAPVSYFAADLNAAGSSRLGQADASLKTSQGINFQTIWSYTNDPSNRFQGSLSSGVCYGWNAGARYFEIYKSDLTSSDAAVVNAIAQARTGSGC